MCAQVPVTVLVRYRDRGAHVHVPFLQELDDLFHAVSFKDGDVVFDSVYALGYGIS